MNHNPSPWMVLTVTTAVQVMVSAAALTPPVFAAEAARDIGIDPRMIGFYASLVYLGAMVTSLPAGSLVVRVGAIRVSQIGLALCFVGLAVLAGANLLMVLLGALLIGFGYGPITPASSHILAHSTPADRRGLMFSIKQTGVPLGGFVAGAAVPPMVLVLGWQGAALAVGVAALAVAVLAQGLQPALDRNRHHESVRSLDALVLGPLRVVWRDQALRRLAIASFTFAAIQLSLSAFLVVYLMERAGLGLVTAGLVLSAAQLGGVAGRVAWGILADRVLGARKTLTLLAFGMAVSAGLAALFTAGWPVAAITAVSVLFGATAIGWNGVFLAEVAHLAPTGQAGPATGGVLFFTFAGVVFGPSLFGVLAGLPGGYGLAFGAVAAGSAFGGLLVLTAGRSHRPH